MNMDSTIVASLISAAASIITAIISTRPRSTDKASVKGYYYRPVKKLPWIITLFLLIVWLVSSPILIHWDIAGLNIFVIIIVSLVLAFSFPIRPTAAAAIVLILHPVNFFLEDLGKFFHGVSPNFPFSEHVGVDISSVILLLSIYFANAIIVSIVCSWRGRVPLTGHRIESSAKKNASHIISEEVERLADLHSRGVLSDEEFRAAKNRILGT
jgi:hypothetical protein